MNESEATTSAMTPLRSVSYAKRNVTMRLLQVISEKKGSECCKAADKELIDTRLHRFLCMRV